VLPNGERLIDALRLLLVEHKKDVDAALAKVPAMKGTPKCKTRLKRPSPSRAIKTG
jgi:hypothetical protein